MPKHKTTLEQKDREKIIKEVNNTKKYSKLKQLKNATITSFKLQRKQIYNLLHTREFHYRSQ